MFLARIAIAALAVPAVFTATGLADEDPAKQQAPAVADGLSIRLSELKEALWYPPPEGSNRMLIAEISGAPVRRAWLATRADAAERVALSRTGKEEFQINLCSRDVCELVALDDASEELRVFVETTAGAVECSLPVRFGRHGPPAQLDFAWDSAVVTVGQRRCVSLPGSRERIRLCLADITAGQVRVSLQTDNYKDIVPPASLGPGDVLEFPLAKTRYVLTLDRMVNLLAGEDFAVFTLMSREVWQRDEIERLLSRIRAASVVFLRDDQELTPDVFAAHLREKTTAIGRGRLATDDFITHIASRSSTTGNPYRLKLADGQIIETEGWLRDQLALMRSTSKPQPSPSP